MSNKDVENKESLKHRNTMAEEKLVTIGQNIKLQRIAKEKSQINVAMEVGISPSKLSKIESGTVGYTVNDLILICEVLGVSPSDVMEENLENASIAELAHRRRLKEFDREEYKRIMRSNR